MNENPERPLRMLRWEDENVHQDSDRPWVVGTPITTPPRRRHPARWAAAGVLLLAAWMIIPAIRVYGGTIGEDNAICHSTLGTIGQAISSRVAGDCANLAVCYDGLAVAFWAGLGCLVMAGLSWWRGRS